MFGINMSKLEELKSLADVYKNNAPFPHISFDGLFDERVLDKIVKTDFDNMKDWQRIKYRYANKVVNNKAKTFSPTTKELFKTLNSEPFMEILKDLTGIERPLLADESLEGAGLACTMNGGSLGIHRDRNKIRASNGILDRRVNLLIYLNKNWKEEFGGHLEFWDTDLKCINKYSPIFNRCIIFNVTDIAYHGHPYGLECPLDMNRKSIAVYYGTKGRPSNEISPVHGTQYKFRVEKKHAK